MKKTDTIQLRVDEDLKNEFNEVAEKRGVLPSELMRQLMKMTVKGYIPDESSFNEHDQALIQIIQVLVKASYKEDNTALFDAIHDSSLLWAYKDIAHNHADYCSKGDRERYNRVYNKLTEEDLGMSDYLKENPDEKRVFPNSRDAYAVVREALQNRKLV